MRQTRIPFQVFLSTLVGVSERGHGEQERMAIAHRPHSALRTGSVDYVLMFLSELQPRSVATRAQNNATARQTAASSHYSETVGCTTLLVLVVALPGLTRIKQVPRWHTRVLGALSGGKGYIIRLGLPDERSEQVGLGCASP